MKNSIIYTALALIVMASCTSNKSTENNGVLATANDEIYKAYFFIGEWENREKDGVMTERWHKQNDSVFTGESYFISGNDTMSSEKITIEQRGNELYFIPTLKGQNNNQPVEFKLIESSPTHLVFENPTHDFPEKITYTLLTKDSLLAEISGMMDNNATTHQFPLKRVK
jgi:hypothetical protein